MIRYIRRAAAFCLLLLVALLVNAARVQLFEADALDDNPANRRTTIERYDQPRGDIVVGDEPVTGSKDTGEQLAHERTYRHGPLYAPVTGYASQTYGTTLLENAEDDVLSGTASVLAPLPLWGDLTRSRQPGGDVVTTVDAAVQRAGYEGLAGRRGAVAALDPGTGAILALVSSPSYDPERLSGTGSSVTDAWAELNRSASRPMLNRAIRQTYPPGSAFKIVTAAAALDAGVVEDPDEETDTPSPYVLPGTTTTLPDEARGCENASLAEAIRVSCNTVMARLGVEVGLEDMLEAVGGFGFNDDDLRIPSRVARSNFDTDMSDDQLAQSAIGQFDTTATPLQMAMVAAAVANDGELRRPHLVDRVTDHDGRTVRREGSDTYRRATKRETARQLQRMMVDVVENGTGTNAAIDGVRVGGKTGTAQHGVDNTGTPYAWFISWARDPDSGRPAVAVAVVVEDASANRADVSGGGNAAPIARAVMEAALTRSR
ncbi:MULTISPECIES: penicillin-binding transpeptidase domain-containing protein [unclassified Streptomyces]|uniref:penicillin-binding transpeptidase domain-containing protein n=1 Tax=unclassified Streptomyces TaxID=2593676 RepID=UPI0001C1CA2C|nr:MULTISPECIES: penicillin-binding transpeptidase domain-containing protein [unclassified Streptomyces]MYR69753.1 penicillin-binding protein 2 [Streptomyces sp. SID4939]MYS04362.1 penicillin-binding protein 2 [Streptomyces sp. SID4940]MYT63098.1 penicillin-binding protein 2 [Streptomyces sp. SID8357]MYT88626.1 penicillin-binding protein 2 [Streptomyces sp. SID8360]MYU33536.1 penicillin-binding protein 2 [Streptomyces sp. SID8358]MYW39816.1 penicillin-binding protein 2 [Streptomyces sp. SID1]